MPKTLASLAGGRRSSFPGRVWLALLGAVWLCACPAGAWNQNADSSNPGVRLRWLTMPVHFRVNPATPAGNVDAGAQTATEAVRASFRTWEGAPLAAVTFSDDGETTATYGTTSSGNLVSFADTDFPFGGALAVTPYSYDAQGGILVRACVLFNPAIRFTTRSGAGAYDVQSIATHEIGHLLGLGHSAVLASTMMPFAVPGGTWARDLSADDVAGIRSVYPAAGGLAATGSITGRVYRASTAGGLFGAHVFATGPDGLTAAGTFSSRDGNYTIAGLAPGRYTVAAEPLDGPLFPANLSSPYHAANALSLDTGFPTSRHRDGATVEIAAGLATGGITIATGEGPPGLNLRRVAAVPAGAGSLAPSACPTEAARGTTGKELIIAGTGLTAQTQLAASGSDVGLTLVEAFSLADGTPALRFSLAVQASAALGPRDLVARNPDGALSVLVGGLTVVEPPRDSTGPLVTCSYDRPAAAVGPGSLTITFTADEDLGGTPRARVERPGGGGDLDGQPLVATASPRVWTLGYRVLPADGATVLDGPCRVDLVEARDLAGNSLRRLENDTFVVDTVPPSATLVFSKSADQVGPGRLDITASFTEPLLGSPSLRLERPSGANKVVKTTLAPVSSNPDGTSCSWVYTVVKANGTTVTDGATVLALEGMTDAAGNAGQSMANNVIVIDTTPPGSILHALTSRPAAGVGPVTIALDTSEPLAAAPVLTIERPGLGQLEWMVPMSPDAGRTRWTHDFVVLPADDDTILDGTATLLASGLADGAGNEAGPATAGLPIDTRAPTVSFSFSQSAYQVKAGPLFITATFSEPLWTTPALSLDRPGGGNSLAATWMTPNGSASVWSLRHAIAAQDGLTVLDGLGTVDLFAAADHAGNEAVVSSAGVLLFDTGAQPPIASLTFSRDAGRVPAGPLAVTATFRRAPSPGPPRLSRLGPDGTRAWGPSPMMATASATIFTATLNVPASDGWTCFDGFHTLTSDLPDGTRVTLFNDRFRSVTPDGTGLRHVMMTVTPGCSLVALPVEPETALTAADLARFTGATAVVRTVVANGSSRFETYLPGAGAAPFALDGAHGYALFVPREAKSVLLRFSGRSWSDGQRSVLLGRGANLVGLSWGTAPAATARDLGVLLGGVLSIARPARTAPDRLTIPTSRWSVSLDAYLAEVTPDFPLALEPALLVVMPRASQVVLPAAP